MPLFCFDFVRFVFFVVNILRVYRSPYSSR